MFRFFDRVKTPQQPLPPLKNGIPKIDHEDIKALTTPVAHHAIGNYRAAIVDTPTNYPHIVDATLSNTLKVNGIPERLSGSRFPSQCLCSIT